MTEVLLQQACSRLGVGAVLQELSRGAPAAGAGVLQGLNAGKWVPASSFFSWQDLFTEDDPSAWPR